jgi:hypothetical protein
MTRPSDDGVRAIAAGRVTGSNPGLLGDKVKVWTRSLDRQICRTAAVASRTRAWRAIRPTGRVLRAGIPAICRPN